MSRSPRNTHWKFVVTVTTLAGCGEHLGPPGADGGEAPCSTFALWSGDASAAYTCSPQPVCDAGVPSDADDPTGTGAACAPCASDLEHCAPRGACTPGTALRGTRKQTPVVCHPCDVGTYCAGGTAAPLACPSGTWDHDANPATACVAWTDCRPGERVAAGGSATVDRTCEPCAGGETSAHANADSCEPAAWILSYFRPEQSVAADSLHLAYSRDGLTWTNLAYGKAVHQLSDLGTNHIRDPFLFRKNDGTFVYIATDWTLAENDANYWNRPSSKIFVADSTDLVTFTRPRLLDLSDIPGPGGTEMHAWAPEAYWDAERQSYAIIWSGNQDRNRIYVSYTRDFETISNPTPDVLFDPGYDVIDATIEREHGRSYLFFKDETGAGKDIQIARAPSVALTPGSFERWDGDYITRGASQTAPQYTEGPLALWNAEFGRWFMFADFYGAGGFFGAWSSPSLDADPSTWERLSPMQYRFPGGVRHAHALRVTQTELATLIEHHGASHGLRTTYGEGGSPFYVGHSWYHGIVTYEADRNAGQLASDFEWKIVPGLADPEDPELLSFEAVGFPGRFLRIDPTDRYPACGEGANRGYALCWVPPEERHHLMWLDDLVDTESFRREATFRRVPGLNGNTSMVSLQWFADPARYLRHRAYQVFATPIRETDAVERNDASFVLE